WDGHVILTSGASEALSIALRGRRVLASAVEHDAVWRAAPGAEVIAADPILRAVPAGAELVAVQHANSETGVLQPLADLAPARRARLRRRARSTARLARRRRALAGDDRRRDRRGGRRGDRARITPDRHGRLVPDARRRLRRAADPFRSPRDRRVGRQRLR